MAGELPFETVIFAHPDEAQNQVILRDLRDAVEKQEIKIIDIRRYQDQLVVSFRRLSP